MEGEASCSMMEKDLILGRTVELVWLYFLHGEGTKRSGRAVFRLHRYKPVGIRNKTDIGMFWKDNCAWDWNRWGCRRVCPWQGGQTSCIALTRQPLFLRYGPSLILPNSGAVQLPSPLAARGLNEFRVHPMPDEEFCQHLSDDELDLSATKEILPILNG